MRYYERRTAALGRLEVAFSNFHHGKVQELEVRGKVAAATRVGCSRREIVRCLANAVSEVRFTHARTFKWED